MKRFIKQILGVIGLYHPVQLRYRAILSGIKRISYRISYRSFRGTGFLCNICGSSYSRFVPGIPDAENEVAITKHQVIAGYGDHIFCPNCLSNARERLVIACLDDLFILEGKSVLHFSPEKYVYRYVKSKANVVTADLNPGFYSLIDPAVRKEDATQLQLPENTFDLIIANHVLEHIPDDLQAMQEFFRVLKPGGSAILQVPYSEILETTIETPGIHDPALQSLLYGQNDHVRIYALNDYLKRLRHAGFTAEPLPASTLEKYQKYATQPGEVFFNISKPA